MRHVAVSGMKVGKLVRLLVKGQGADSPIDPIHCLPGAGQFDASRFEKGHGKIASEINPIVGEADAYRKSLYQIFLVVRVIESAGTIEQRDGNIDRWLLPAIPRYAKMNILEGESLIASDREGQSADRSPGL